MKRVILCAVLLAGCTTQTEFGECRGLLDKDKEDAKLNYSVSGVNVAGAVIFSETFVVPALVVGAWLWCPTSRKP